MSLLPILPSLTSRLRAQAAPKLAGLAAAVLVCLGLLWWATHERIEFEMAEVHATEAERNDRLALAHEQQVRLVLRGLDEALLTLADDPELTRDLLSGRGELPRHLRVRGLGIGVAGMDARASGTGPTLPAGWLERLVDHHRRADSHQAFLQVPAREPGATWITTLSRPLLDAQGRMQGIVFASLDPQELLDFFQQAELGASDVIVLLGSDGLARARRAGARYSFGDEQSNSQLTIESARRPSGHFITDSPVDGERRFYSFRNLPDYGLTAAVGTSYATVLAPVRERVARYHWMTVLGSLALTVGAMALGMAIHRHDRAAARLRQSEQRLSGIIESAMDAIITVDADQHIVVFNAAAAEMFHCAPEAALGQPLTDFLPERFRAAHAGHMTHFSRTQSTPRSMGRGNHIWALRADGQEFPADASISYIEIDGMPLYSVVLRDITARIAAEAALRTSEESYRLLFENNLDGLLLGDRVGAVSRVNPAAATLLGLPVDEIRSRGLEVLRGEGNPLDWALSECQHSGHARGLFSVRRGNGRLAHMDATFAAYVDSGGHLRSSVILHDVTERLEAQAAQEALASQLRQSQKMEALGSIAGGIAHDFNNVIAAILGNARLAQGNIGCPPIASRYLTEISSAGLRARELVKRIMTFSRKQPAVFVRQPLGPVVREAVGLLRATLPSGVRISLAGDAQVFEVMADATQLHQVVMNLGTNAWQAMGRRTGHIEVALEAVPGASWVKLSFQDNGSGMDPATQARIFEPFFTTKPDGEGTGLGLSVVQGIVQAHGGEISVASAPGQGCRFDIRLPLAARDAEAPPALRQVPQVPQASPEAAPPAAAGANRLVVYVDDYEAMVAMVGAVLETQGYRVRGFDRSTDALDYLRAHAHEVDLLITDYNMPEMSGLDLSRAARALRPSLPVIVASGHLSADLRAGAAAAGVDCLFDKPAGIDELCLRIAQVLQARPAD